MFWSLVFNECISVFPLRKSNVDFYYYLVKEYKYWNRVQIRPILYSFGQSDCRYFFVLAIMRLIQTYSEPRISLAYSQHCIILALTYLEPEAYSNHHETSPRNIQNLAIVRTVYSGIIQPYPGMFRTLCNLAYAAAWLVDNPGILRTLQ